MPNDPSDKNGPANEDQVWDLLSREAAIHPVEPSPWFATRTAARAYSLPQQERFRLSRIVRWMIPLPLAGAAAVLFLTFHHGESSRASSFVSSDQEFEQHMEFLFASSE